MNQNTSSDIPERFSLPTKDHFDITPFFKYFKGKNPDLLCETIIGIAAGLRLDFPRSLAEPPKHAFDKIATELDRHDENAFEEICLEAYKNFNGPKIRNINDAWFEIARLIQVGRPKKSQPEIEWSEKDEEEGEEEETPSASKLKARGPEPIKAILPRTYISPEVYWGEKKRITPAITAKNQKGIAPARKESINEFITRRAPSINYLQVFILISRHTKNRFSRRGRKVYPYGQEYVSQKLDISLRTVWEIFSWLRRQGIIIKRSNENPDLDKSATWFICTSWKQSFYFRDPKGLRSKKGSRRSLRKRHFTMVNT